MFHCLYSSKLNNFTQCASPVNLWYRYRDAKSKGKAFNTSLGLAKFSDHSFGCHCLHTLSDHTYIPATKISKTDTDHDNVSVFSVCLDKTCEPAICSTVGATEHANRLYDVFKSIPDNFMESTLKIFAEKISLDDRLRFIAQIIDLENNNIGEDINTIQTSFKNLKSLKDINIQQYLGQRNKVVRVILDHLSKHKLNDSHSNNIVSNAVLVEMVYKSRNSHFVGPVSIMQNLTVLSLTGSKTAVDIIGSICAGGKYKTLCRWFEDNTSTSPAIPPGDAVFMFDNEQVIGKTWFVKPNNKVKSSVITNVAAASLNTEMLYQGKAEYHPARWFIGERSVAVVPKLLDENDDHFTFLKQVHLTQLKLFLKAAIDLVLGEQSQAPVLTDNIDKEVERVNKIKNFKLCSNCGLMLPKSKRKCSKCKTNLSRVEETQEIIKTQDRTVEEVPLSSTESSGTNIPDVRYEYVPSGHSEDPVQVNLLDPVFVNPNSFQNLALVLRHIGKVAGIKRYGGSEREWLIICCDGLPYSMILQLTQDYIVCTECNETCIGDDIFQLHVEEKHTNLQNCGRIREFDWVLLRTGDGHYEMNLLKSFFELNWEVCLKQLAQKMGWVSDMALKSAKNCYDNHKTWQLFQIFHFGTLLELVLPYVRQCVTDSVEPNADGFLVYASKRQSDPNYTYMFEMVTRYCQGILNFRIGVRRNNARLIESAKMMTRNLFHGRNHPKYQEIELVDTMLRNLMPVDLKDFFERFESITKSKDHSKGQGYDFILEELNKEVKSWLRKGVPSDSLWLCVCRNHDLLKNIKANTFSLLNLTRESDVRNIDIKDGIFEWRMLLRESKYLTEERVLHSDLNGSKLHPDLEKFTELAHRKRSWRLMKYFLDNVDQEAPYDSDLRKPVYVTSEEAEKFESLENQTVAYITEMTMQMIDSFPDLETKQTLLQKFKKSVNGKAKRNYISFFQEITEMMENLVAIPSVELDVNELGLTEM